MDAGWHTRGRWRRLARRGAILLFGAGLALLPPAVPAQESPKELRARATQALNAGAFEDAIPPIQQLIDWYKDTKDPTIVGELESLYYNLGLCHLFLGHFAEVRNAYDVYLKKYGGYPRAAMVHLFIADSWRYEQKLDEALKAYELCLKKHDYAPDLQADIFGCMARCHLAVEAWDKAVPLLIETYRRSNDPTLRNWAASMLTIAYLKDLKVDKVYELMPMLLQPESFASRSVALNMAALAAGDELFADEKFRDALWIYRLVYPHDTLAANSQAQLARFQRQVRILQRQTAGRPRDLMRAQESVSEIQGEVEALEKIPNYDPELFFRIARSYLEIRRCREAGDLFYYLYQEGLTDKKEECLYLAFFAASKVRPWDRAFERGAEYMTKYPWTEGGKTGQYYDGVSLTVAQLHANMQTWPKVIEIITKALEVHPKHENIVECLFLRGYAEFMEEKFQDCVTDLVRMNTEFPGNEREAEGAYWTGMAQMFDKNYEEAQKYFTRVVQDFPRCAYVEDASFRSATCDFGLSKYNDAEAKFLKFVQNYPESKLLGEAYVTLGDISGVFGELAEGVRRYQKSSETDINIELYNHASFRCGEMLKAMTNYAGVVTHFNAYIERNRPDSNLALAIYWIGDAYWEMAQKEKALGLFLEALRKYGKNRKDLGVDFILQEWVGRAKHAGKDLEKKSWADLRSLLASSLAEQQYTLALRLDRIALFDPSASDAEKQAMLKFMLREENLPYASPGVLELMIDEAKKSGNRALAVHAAETIIKDFPETDYALTARKMLADAAIEKKNFDEAIVHLNIIREVYASSDQAADALLTLGRLYRDKEEYDKAAQAYKDLLQVKEWKSLWPAGLYGLGEIERTQRKYDEACAYFERIYVLYGSHREWVAKAYVARADCLKRLQEYAKAIETLNEFLGRTDLASTPEAAEAQKMKAELQKRI